MLFTFDTVDSAITNSSKGIIVSTAETTMVSPLEPLKVDDLFASIDEFKALQTTVDELKITVNKLAEQNELQITVKKLTEQNDELTEQNDELTEQIDELTEQIDELQNTVKKRTEQNDELTVQNDELTEQIDELQNTVKKLTEQNDCRKQGKS